MKLLSTALFVATLVGTLAPVGASAQTSHTLNQGYLMDSTAEIIRTSDGICWHTGEWNPSMANVEGCDGYMKPVAMNATPAPAPAPMVAAPMAPAPTPAPAMAPRKIALSGDALFAFDKSTLKPEGKSTLDDLVRQMGGAEFDLISITGHTDRLGSDAYNQRLSERRAQTVKEYLVSQNVKAIRIDAKGVGETQPVTASDACTGKKSAKVIACLQPDRRVDIEMTDTVVR